MLVFVPEPLDGFGYSFFEIHPWPPSQFIKYFSRGNFFACIVSRPRGNVPNLDSASYDPVNCAGDLSNRNPARAFKVINLVLSLLLHCEQMSPRQIIDVDIISILTTVPLNHNRLPSECLPNEDRYD